ncbi:unnamed protein product [Vitrella brassicaformis CCMP3155]|uniref:Uncharacterized protein n=2 Tax=Vitrella brassicaformis TaxID=1169539 RepID=A0A0G4ELD4_VITBC|nr:unnamed protein product [Vitrella brassicaformis CCMP3155]|eukprot:CEL97762.1 unnamed protein product [Vitrella brassicaformis CCMP3155]
MSPKRGPASGVLGRRRNSGGRTPSATMEARGQPGPADPPAPKRASSAASSPSANRNVTRTLAADRSTVKASQALGARSPASQMSEGQPQANDGLPEKRPSSMGESEGSRPGGFNMTQEIEGRSVGGVSSLGASPMLSEGADRFLETTDPKQTYRILKSEYGALRDKFDEQQREFDERRKDIESAMADTDAENQRLYAEAEHYRRQREELINAMMQLEEELASAETEKRATAQKAKDDIEGLRVQLQNVLAAEEFRVDKSRRASIAHLEKLQKDIDHIYARYMEAEQLLAMEQSQRVALTAEAAQIEKDDHIRTLQRKMQELLQENDALRQRIHELQNDLFEAQEDKQREVSRLHERMMESMQHLQAHYNEAKQQVASLKVRLYHPRPSQPNSMMQTGPVHARISLADELARAPISPSGTPYLRGDGSPYSVHTPSELHPPPSVGKPPGGAQSAPAPSTPGRPLTAPGRLPPSQGLRLMAPSPLAMGWSPIIMVQGPQSPLEAPQQLQLLSSMSAWSSRSHPTPVGTPMEPRRGIDEEMDALTARMDVLKRDNQRLVEELQRWKASADRRRPRVSRPPSEAGDVYRGIGTPYSRLSLYTSPDEDASQRNKALNDSGVSMLPPPSPGSKTERRSRLPVQLNMSVSPRHPSSWVSFPFARDIKRRNTFPAAPPVKTKLGATVGRARTPEWLSRILTKPQVDHATQTDVSPTRQTLPPPLPQQQPRPCLSPIPEESQSPRSSLLATPQSITPRGARALQTPPKVPTICMMPCRLGASASAPPSPWPTGRPVGETPMVLARGGVGRSCCWAPREGDRDVIGEVVNEYIVVESRPIYRDATVGPPQVKNKDKLPPVTAQAPPARQAQPSAAQAPIPPATATATATATHIYTPLVSPRQPLTVARPQLQPATTNSCCVSSYLCSSSSGAKEGGSGRVLVMEPSQANLCSPLCGMQYAKKPRAARA